MKDEWNWMNGQAKQVKDNHRCVSFSLFYIERQQRKLRGLALCLLFHLHSLAFFGSLFSVYYASVSFTSCSGDNYTVYCLQSLFLSMKEREKKLTDRLQFTQPSTSIVSSSLLVLNDSLSHDFCFTTFASDLKYTKTWNTLRLEIHEEGIKVTEIDECSC